MSRYVHRWKKADQRPAMVRCQGDTIGRHSRDRSSEASQEAGPQTAVASAGRDNRSAPRSLNDPDAGTARSDWMLLSISRPRLRRPR